uniref:Dolichyl-diphosphooligosaccharide--protein glycosyltransferase subunit 1 n=1 Tax=Schistosoma japonicum TaxID=6182 RepID=Q5DEM7_SCHJA|nr:SJCHGC00848 protein [Schistosoma japonicum]
MLVLVLFLLVAPSLGVKNANVTRTIRFKGGVVKIHHDILLSETPAEYQFVIEERNWKHLAFISASMGDSKSPRKVPVKLTGKPYTYSLVLGNPSTQQAHVFVDIALTELLEPRPSEIYQADKQFVKFRENAYFYSPYSTDTQLTHIRLPKGQLLTYSATSIPPVINDNNIVYGPYESRPAFSVEPLVLHFEYYAPFVTVTEMTRLIEVSHWGNIAVEETLEIVNTGAKLRGPFSRLDFDYGIGQPVAANSLKTALPASAKDIYYRDEIGNISTSTVRNLLDSIEVTLVPRFPLMGGWKTRYTLGYNIPAYEFLYRSGSNFALVMRFVDHIYKNQFIRNLTLKIVLPEVVSDIQFEPPFPVYEQHLENMKTYLDTSGRTVIVCKAGNLIDEHMQDFKVKYHFNLLMILREPLMLVAAFLCIFGAMIIYVRLDFSIYKDEKSELRLRAQTLVDEAQALLRRRSFFYQSYEDALTKYKGSKDSTQFANDRRKLEADNKSLNQQLVSIQTKMGDLYPDGVDKLNDINNLDQQYRDLIHESIQLAEKLLTSKLTKVQYQSFNDDIHLKKTDIINKIDSISEYL